MHFGLGNFTVARLFEHKNALWLVCSNNLNRHLLVTLSQTHQHTYMSGLFVSLERTCRISSILCVARRRFKVRITAIVSFSLSLSSLLFRSFQHLSETSIFTFNAMLIRSYFLLFDAQQHTISNMCALVFSITGSFLDLKKPKRFSFSKDTSYFQCFLYFFHSILVFCFALLLIRCF